MLHFSIWLHFTLFLKFYFTSNIISIVEKNVCPLGPLIRVGRVMVWRKEGGTNVSYFFFASLSAGVRVGNKVREIL